MELNSELTQQLNDKIIGGQELLNKVSQFGDVNGISKLQKKIKQEINFLVKTLKLGRVKKEHLLCTNLHHFWALANTLETCNGLVAVLQHFTFKPEGDSNGSTTRLCVDVVAEKGRQWMKVVARNPRALTQLCSGAGEYGQRNVIDQAQEFLACAKQHLYMFRPPEVVFVFSSGIEESLASMLEDIGVIIVGKRMPDSYPCQFGDEDSECSDGNEGEDDTCEDIDCQESNSQVDSSNSPEQVPMYSDLNVEPNRLNLDVTTLLAYVSALTNGGCKWNYKQPILREQAAQEMKHPVKPVLEALFEGKQLCVCKSAFDSFMTILNTLGGPGERERAAEFITRLTVVEDGEEDWENLTTRGRIKERSRAVFATGVALRAITVTANGGFVRSARNQGYEFPVFVHESRALTEGKQIGPPSL